MSFLELALALVFCVNAGETLPPRKAVAAEIPHCGVACVYGMLRVHEIEATVADVKDRFRALDPGADLNNLSLAQVRQVLESFGLNAVSVRADLRSPGSIPTPAIIRFNRDEAGRKARTAHLLLLRSVSDQGAELTDFSVSGTKGLISLETLQAVSDGEMVLVSREPISLPVRKERIVAGVAAVVAILALGFLGWQRIRRHG